MWERVLKVVITFTIIGFSYSVLLGGIQPRVEGLRDNTEYMSILGQEQELIAKEDSIAGRVSQLRELLMSDIDNRAQYSSEIMKLENEVFEVRNKKGALGIKINMIEQEYVINNLDSHIEDYSQIGSGGAKLLEAGNNHPNIVLNSNIKNNLRADDYSTLILAESNESVIYGLFLTYSENYDTLNSWVVKYSDATDEKSAKEFYGAIVERNLVCRTIADSIALLWNPINNNKSYAYSYLFDLMNDTQSLASYEQKLLNARRLIMEYKDVSHSETMTHYIVEKNLLLDYELMVAKALKLDAAADSLQEAHSQFVGIDFHQPKINYAERSFIKYDSVRVDKTNIRRDIPKRKIHERGTVYGIMLGSYPAAKRPDFFRGITPLYYEISDERYNYYSGTLRSQQESESTIEMLNKAGFRNQKVVVWRDNVFENLSDILVDGVRYRIEVVSNGDYLSADVKERIAKFNDSTDIARVAQVNENGESYYLFIISSFTSPEVAAATLDAILESDENLKGKIESINN